MNKFIICFILFTIILKINAVKLYGEDLAETVDILNNALDQLRRRNGPYYTMRGVLASFKFAPHVIYTFDAQLLDPDGKLDLCIVETSLSFGNPKNVLIVISCNGKEKIRRVLQGKIL